jgi:hypothetical protein
VEETPFDASDAKRRLERLEALAAEIGTEIVFSAVLAISGAFGVLAWRTPESEPPERQSIEEVAAAISTRPVLVATAFVAVPPLMFGAGAVLVMAAGAYWCVQRVW